MRGALSRLARLSWRVAVVMTAVIIVATMSAWGSVADARPAQMGSGQPAHPEQVCPPYGGSCPVPPVVPPVSTPPGQTGGGIAPAVGGGTPTGVGATTPASPTQLALTGPPIRVEAPLAALLLMVGVAMALVAEWLGRRVA
jgi:hypothetical protein